MLCFDGTHNSFYIDMGNFVMIEIKLVCVGNLKEKFWKDAVSEYSKRLSKFCKLKIVEIEEQNKY